MLTYFDLLRLTPLFKQLLASFDEVGRQNDRCTKPIRRPRLRRIMNALAGCILESPASISQARRGNTRMGDAALVAFECVLPS